LISHLDVQIGRILQALEKNDMMDNTYVFLTADHGLAIGSHGLMGKQNMYEHSIRVPMMVMGPAIPKGKEVSADVYLQDVMATSLEIAGVGIPSFVEFKSLLGLVNATEKSSYPNGIYGAYLNKQRMIRKDDFKLIVYPDAKRMLLYDLKNDPYEMKDLNGLDDYKEKQQSLLLDLIEMQRQLHDTLDITSIVN
jgi:arylsulfatase A-like enzyme